MNYENFKIVKSGTGFVQYLHNQKESTIIKFDSAASLVKFSRERLSPNWQSYSLEERHWVYGDDGYGTESLSGDALISGMVLQKHVDLVEKFKEDIYRRRPELLELKHRAQLKKRRRVFNEEDGELDIDRYMSADPAMFYKVSKTDAKGSFVTMHYDQPTSVGNEFKDFINGIAFCVAMVDIIESSGKSVELTFGETTSNAILGVGYTSIIVIAKEANEPLDVSRLLTFGLSAICRKYTIDVALNCQIGSGINYGFGGQIYNFNSCPSIAEFLDADILIKNSGMLRDNEISEVIGKVERLFQG